MPLPVERSQGSVSALVARFQTAADRDAEQGRRMSLPPPSSSRRNSSLGLNPNVTGSQKAVSPQPTPSKGPASLPGLDGSGLPAPDDKETKAARKSESLGPVEEKEEVKQAAEEKPKTGEKDTKRDGSIHAVDMAAKDSKGSADHPTSSDESPTKVTETLKSKVHEVKEAVKETGMGGAPAKDSPAGKDAPVKKEDKPQTPSKAKSTPRPTPLKSTTASTPKAKTATLSKAAATPSKGSNAVAVSPTTSKAHKDPASSPTQNKAKAPASSPTTSTSTRNRLDSNKSQRSVQPKTPTKASTTSSKSKLEPSATALAQPKEAAKSATSNATVTVLPRSNSTRSTTTRPLTAQSTGPKPKVTTTKLSTPGPKSPEDVISPLRPQLTGHTASSLAKTRTPVSEKQAKSQGTMSLGRAAGAKARPKAGSPTPTGTTSDRKSTSTPSRITASSSSSRLMQGTAASKARAADSPARKEPGTPNKTGSIKRKVMGSSTPGKAGKGDEDVGTVTLHGKAVGSISGAPPGARLGLAAAGIGKGGNMGKELNDETNAKLRSENGQDRQETPVIPASPISRQPQTEHNELDASTDELLGRTEIPTGKDTTTEDTRETSRGTEQGRRGESGEKGQGEEGEQVVETGSKDLEAVDQESEEQRGVSADAGQVTFGEDEGGGEALGHARVQSLAEIPDVI